MTFVAIGALRVNIQHPRQYNHLFTRRLEISVDTEQLASPEAS